MRTSLTVALVVFASAALAQDTEPDPVPALIEQLGDESFDVREAATQKLVELGETAVEALQKAAASQDPEVAWRAETALAQIEEKKRQEIEPQVLRPAAMGEFRIELRVVDGEGGVVIERFDGGEGPGVILEGVPGLVFEGDRAANFQTSAPSPVLRAHLGLEPGQGVVFEENNEGLERFGLAPFDIVLGVDDRPATSILDLLPMLESDDGETFSLELIRRGERLTREVVVGADPERTTTSPAVPGTDAPQRDDE